MEFSVDGLQIYNGGLTIFNDDNEVLLSYDNDSKIL